jgi:hypothetical protein
MLKDLSHSSSETDIELESKVPLQPNILTEPVSDGKILKKKKIFLGFVSDLFPIIQLLMIFEYLTTKMLLNHFVLSFVSMQLLFKLLYVGSMNFKKICFWVDPNG